GFGDCLELLEMLAPEQVRTMLDIDGWKGYRLDPHRLGLWLESLMAANPDRAVEQFRALDIELISLLFKLHSTTYDYSYEEGLPNDIPLYSITPDRNYIVVFNIEQSDQNLVIFLQQVLEKLYQSDLSFAIRLVESVRWET